MKNTYCRPSHSISLCVLHIYINILLMDIRRSVVSYESDWFGREHVHVVQTKKEKPALNDEK